MKVYHGSNKIVDKPDVMHSCRALDFGKGFYVTTVWEQAQRWAKRKAQMMESGKPIVNIYEMTEEMPGRFTVKTFHDDLDEWIDFVCRCRDEYDDYLKYDIILYLAKEKSISLEEAMNEYYASKLADQISRGVNGIQYLDYKILAQMLMNKSQSY